MSSSPSQRYAQSRIRASHSELLTSFRDARSFDLDHFQLEACMLLDEGKSVLVAAPTGAGKTVVAEYSIFRAMADPSARVFYTTPMKALSNQKFSELVDSWGQENVGLLTGDINVNSEARIVVMTTEVLRNMLYADTSELQHLSYVVMDEVHYLADRFRGAVWEEVIIHLPRDVKLISLSATVSNAEEFGAWLQAVRGNTDIVVSEERPVPLDQHVLIGSKFIDLFDSHHHGAQPQVNPEVVRLANATGRAPQQRGRGRRSFGSPQSNRINRAGVIGLLGERQLLPAIFFIFSRKGCDEAVWQCVRDGVRLTDGRERQEIKEVVDQHCRTILDEDLSALGYWEWLEGLERGVAAHHAGLIPAFKETVEDLFQRKLLKVVFATETLALGINMPARTVVLEKLEKFNGEARVPLTPGEYTQLTGRAGRRGIDVEGHSLIQWNPNLNPQLVGNLASKRTYPLNSSFRPTYNMAVNLISQYGRERARDLLETSFAQFQADRAVVGLARKIEEQEQSLEGYASSMACHVGDFTEYQLIRRTLTDIEKSSASGSRADRDKRTQELGRLRKQMKAHPCHACPDREKHARWAERWWRLKRDTDKLQRQIDSRTGAVARVFDNVCDVLLTLGYLSNDAVENTQTTEAGELLARIYGERDLLIAESIRRQIWDELDAPALAAMCSSIVFEPRREEGEIGERYLPPGPFRPALKTTQSLWDELEIIEARHKLPGTIPLALGLTLAMYKWCKQSRLDDVLFDADMPAGDFVRWTKQTVDLLDQLAKVAPEGLAKTAREALAGINRGIVAYSGVSA